jgi:hypothetical protein
MHFRAQNRSLRRRPGHRSRTPGAPNLPSPPHAALLRKAGSSNVRHRFQDRPPRCAPKHDRRGEMGRVARIAASAAARIATRRAARATGPQRHPACRDRRGDLPGRGRRVRSARWGTPKAAPRSIPAAAAIATRRDEAIAEALGDDQWAEYQAFALEEEAGRREIFANRLLADLQTTLHLSDAQKDELFSIFAAEAAGSSPEAWRAPIEAMDNGQTEKLANVLTEEQFKLWRQRAEMWSQLFRRRPEAR